MRFQTVVLYTKFVHKSVQLSPESSVFAVALFVRMMYNTKYQAKRGDPVGEKKNNNNNKTTLGIITNRAYINFVKNGGIIVGKNTYGKLNVNYTGAKEEKLIIGANCSIAGSSNFLLGGEHDYSK